MKERIGFIGLGIMGGGMARNLLKTGFDLRVWNRTPARAQALVEAGAQRKGTLAELVADSDVVITCVSDTPDLDAVALGEGGVLEKGRSGMLLIDTSTVSPEATRKIGGKLAEKGVHMLDAPISGGSEGAARGTLSIMIGGETAQVERAMPLFRAMGKTITHVGALGDGQMTKLVNQILVVGTMLSMGEAFAFARAGGLNLEKALEGVSGGAAGSWTLSNRGPQVLKNDWRPGFTIDLQQKDLRLVLKEADRIGVPLPGTGLIFQLYRSLQKAGLGGEGNHAIYKAIARMAGLEESD